MGQHTKGDLQQMQSLPLEAKLVMTQRRIRDWYDHWNGEVYVAFSGGKDSTVLKHIVDGMYDDVPAVFVNTGLEYPEIQRFVNEIKAGEYACFSSNVVILRPEMRFDEVVQKYGYPVISKEVSKNVQYARRAGENNIHYKKLFGLLEYNGKKSRFCCEKYAYLYEAPFKIGNGCCDVMKKKPVKAYEKQTKRVPFVGTMASESVQREIAWIRTGCNAYDSDRPMSKPLSFWTEQDVLHYIKRFDVPCCPVYGDIQVKRNAYEVDNQINLIDYLGDYEPDDTLETTGCTRTGCIFCLYGCHLEPNPNRIQRLKTTHPKQYQYCIGGGEYVDGIWQPNKEGLGLGKVMDYIGIPYE